MDQINIPSLFMSASTIPELTPASLSRQTSAHLFSSDIAMLCRGTAYRAPPLSIFGWPVANITM